MFKFPDHEFENQQQVKEYYSWLVDCQDCEVVIIGSGPAAFSCGLELLKQDLRVLILDEAEQPGGRLLWERGPVEILSPADELLQELGFPLEDNPPLWIDRLELLAFLVNRYFKNGGMILPGVLIESPPTLKDDSFTLSLLVDNRPLVISARDAVVTTPSFDPARSNKDCREQLKDMVLKTKRNAQGWISAGYQALVPENDLPGCPFINSCLLSGSKAGHIILDKMLE